MATTSGLSGTSTHCMVLRSHSPTTRPPRKPKHCEKTKEIAKSISKVKDVDSTPQTKRKYPVHYKENASNWEMIIPESKRHNETCKKIEDRLISFFSGYFHAGKPFDGVAYINDYEFRGGLEDFKINGKGTLTYLGHPPLFEKKHVCSEGHFKQNKLINGHEIHQNFFERIKVVIEDGVPKEITKEATHAHMLKEKEKCPLMQTERTYTVHYKGDNVSGEAEMIIPENISYNNTCEKIEDCLISFFRGQVKDGKPFKGLAYIKGYEYKGLLKGFKLDGQGTLTYLGHPPLHEKVSVYSEGYFQQNKLINGYQIYQSFYEKIKVAIENGQQQKSYIHYFNGDLFEGSIFGFNPSYGNYIFDSSDKLRSFTGSFLLGIPQRGELIFKNRDEWEGFVSEEFLPDDIGIYLDNETLGQSIRYFEKEQLKFKVELRESSYRYYDLNNPYKCLVIDNSGEKPQYYWEIGQKQIIPFKSTFSEEDIDKRLFERLVELKTNDESILKAQVRFENGIPCFGIIEYQNGHKYYGGLCRSKSGILPHGEGKLFFSGSNARRQEGIFHKGNFINGMTYCTNGDAIIGQEGNYSVRFNLSENQTSSENMPVAVITTKSQATDSSYLITLFAKAFTFAKIANEYDIEPKGTAHTICEYYCDELMAKILPKQAWMLRKPNTHPNAGVNP